MWQQLKQCKSLVDERINFARHLTEVGFNKLEGTKWSKRVATDQLKASCVYLCWDDLLAECKMRSGLKGTSSKPWQTGKGWVRCLTKFVQAGLGFARGRATKKRLSAMRAAIDTKFGGEDWGGTTARVKGRSSIDSSDQQR